MKVFELITKLSEYNPEAAVDVIACNQSHGFTMTYGSSEGCTKGDCDIVSFYVDDLCQSESAI